MKVIICVLLLSAQLAYGADTFVTPLLLKLLKTTEVVHDGSMESIINATQDEWVRKEVAPVSEETRNELLLIADHLGYVNEVAPQEKNYDYAVVLGGRANTMKGRIENLCKCWEKGVRYKQIVFIYPEVNGDDAEAIWKEMKLPEGLAKVKTQFNRVKEISRGMGRKRSPNLGDMIVDWMTHEREWGTALFFSSQPEVQHENALVSYYMPKRFECETVGHSIAKESLETQGLLRTIAHTLRAEGHNIRRHIR